jgi:hypothetical protein
MYQRSPRIVVLRLNGVAGVNGGTAWSMFWFAMEYRREMRELS